MKNLKDIENMSIEALEAIAEDSSVEVPDDIRRKILGIAAAGAFIEEKSEALENSRIADNHGITEQSGVRLLRFAPYLSLAAAAACLMIFFTVPKEPADTFDDPAMAVAELEKAFSYISSKTDKGIKIAMAAEPVFEKTAAAFNTPTKRHE